MCTDSERVTKLRYLTRLAVLHQQWLVTKNSSEASALESWVPASVDEFIVAVRRLAPTVANRAGDGETRTRTCVSEVRQHLGKLWRCYRQLVREAAEEVFAEIKLQRAPQRAAPKVWNGDSALESGGDEPRILSFTDARQQRSTSDAQRIEPPVAPRDEGGTEDETAAIRRLIDSWPAEVVGMLGALDEIARCCCELQSVSEEQWLWQRRCLTELAAFCRTHDLRLRARLFADAGSPDLYEKQNFAEAAWDRIYARLDELIECETVQDVAGKGGGTMFVLSPAISKQIDRYRYFLACCANELFPDETQLRGLSIQTLGSDVQFAPLSVPRWTQQSMSQACLFFAVLELISAELDELDPPPTVELRCLQ